MSFPQVKADREQEPIRLIYPPAGGLYSAAPRPHRGAEPALAAAGVTPRGRGDLVARGAGVRAGGGDAWRSQKITAYNPDRPVSEAESDQPGAEGADLGG